MQITTEQDMLNLCKEVTGPFFITIMKETNVPCELTMVQKNKEMISKGKIGQGSHLQQGIGSFEFSPEESHLYFRETPYLYPSGKILAENPELTGPMTGVLVNCYDPETKRFLFHMRGTNIANPFGFQAAAAGMGIYGQHPSITAALELYQEAGLEKFRQFPRCGTAIDVLPFMKAGKIPQPLFSFGFLDDLSDFPVCRTLDDIAEFESKTKKGLQEKTIPQREAYHFTVPYENVGRVAGILELEKKFYGPIHDSLSNFIDLLRRYEALN
jgi:hypothetical protein